MLSKAMFSNPRNIFTIGFYLFTFAAIGCTTTPPQKAQENMREYIHPNGLVIKLDKDFSAKENENGFIVEPADGSNQNVRFPIEVKISLNKGKEFPNDDSLKRKDVGNRKISYRTEKDDGGSGGEAYSFTGFEKISDGYIKYSQTIQSKYSEPDFQTIWETIENTSLEK
jgi:hypothetical protein